MAEEKDTEDQKAVAEKNPELTKKRSLRTIAESEKTDSEDVQSSKKAKEVCDDNTKEEDSLSETKQEQSEEAKKEKISTALVEETTKGTENCSLEEKPKAPEEVHESEQKSEETLQASSSWLGTMAGFGSFATADGVSAFGTLAQMTNVFANPVTESVFSTETSNSYEEALVFGETADSEDAVDKSDGLQEGIPTGEEDDICVYQIRVRLFRLSEIVEVIDKVDSEKLQLGEKKVEETKTTEVQQTTRKAWTEMGAGIIRANKPKEKGTCRLVMRREGVYKLLLNAPVWKGMPVERVSDKAILITCTSHTEETKDNPKAESFLLRLPRKDQCEELYDAIMTLREGV